MLRKPKKFESAAHWTLLIVYLDVIVSFVLSASAIDKRKVDDNEM